MTQSTASDLNQAHLEIEKSNEQLDQAFEQLHKKLDEGAKVFSKISRIVKNPLALSFSAFATGILFGNMLSHALQKKRVYLAQVK